MKKSLLILLFLYLNIIVINSQNLDILNEEEQLTIRLSECRKLLINETDIKTGNSICKSIHDAYKYVCNDLVYADDITTESGAEECCVNLETIYKTNCKDKNDSLSDEHLFSIIILLMICFVSKGLIVFLNIDFMPEAGAAIIVGIMAGILMEDSEWNSITFDEDLFLRVLLPPIIFEATLAVDSEAFKKLVFPISIFAIIGTAISTFLVSIILYYGSHMVTSTSLSLAESLVFASLISAVDPIAVLAVFNSLGIDDKSTVYVIVFGESILNDGVSVTLFNVFYQFLDGTNINDDAFLNASVEFLIITSGSLFTGAFCGFAASYFFIHTKGMFGGRTECILFILWALLPYYISDSFDWSGIVALVPVGLIMGLRARSHLSRRARRHIGFIVEVIANIFETAIFLYLGIFLVIADYKFDWWLCFLAISACLLGRFMNVFPLSFLINKYWHKRKVDILYSKISKQNILDNNNQKENDEDEINYLIDNYINNDEKNNNNQHQLNFHEEKDFSKSNHNENDLYIPRENINENDFEDRTPSPFLGLRKYDNNINNNNNNNYKRKNYDVKKVDYSSPKYRSKLNSEDHHLNEKMEKDHYIDDVKDEEIERLSKSLSKHNLLKVEEDLDTSFNMNDEVKKEPLLAFKAQIILFIAGLRGALAFALAENIEEYDYVLKKGSKNVQYILGMTASVIIFTIFIFGGMTTRILNYLDFSELMTKSHSNNNENDNKNTEMRNNINKNNNSINNINNENDLNEPFLNKNLTNI